MGTEAKRVLLAIVLMAILSVFVNACEKAPSNTARKTGAQDTVGSTATHGKKTPNDLAREYGQSTATKTEAMDYFFQTFFSANFKEARNITSIEYRRGKSLKDIESEWRRFYDEATKNGLNRKNLGYVTNAYADRTNVGAVIAPSGKVIMAVLFAKTKSPVGNNSGWQIDNVWLFPNALMPRSPKKP